MQPGSVPRISSRQIEPADRDAVMQVLARGFPDRSGAYWADALQMLTARPVPAGCPRFGYMIEADGMPVGVILLIYARLMGEHGPYLRCNVSSWYVEPAFRGYAAFLVRKALGRRDVTYLNISPAADTLDALKAQGYTRYAAGQFFAVPVLAPRGKDIAVREVAPGSHPCDMEDSALLADHAARGCICLVCRLDGVDHPFVFVRRRIAGNRIAAAQLVYCHDMGDVVRCAGALGRFLLRRGILCVILDANGPVQGLVGRYYADKAPKYHLGPERPRLGDLAYTELVLFGP